MRNAAPLRAKQPDLKEQAQRIISYFLGVFDQLNRLKDQLINRLFQQQLQGNRPNIPTEQQLLKHIIAELSQTKTHEAKRQRYMSLEGYRSKQSLQPNPPQHYESSKRRISEFMVDQPATHKAVEEHRKQGVVKVSTPEKFKRPTPSQPKPAPLASRLTSKPESSSYTVVQALQAESERLDRHILKQSLEIKTHHEPNSTMGDSREHELSTIIHNSLRKLQSSRKR